MLLIQNGYIKTITRGDIPRGDILIDGGKILAVGSVSVDENLPVRILNAEGLLVTPGLVDGHSHVGLDEAGVRFEGMDYNEMVDPVTPHMRGIDGIKAADENLQEAPSGGVTAAAVGPGSANVVGGTFSVIKLHGTTVEDMILRQDVAMKAAFGENPKFCYGQGGKAPMTHMGIAALLRELLFKAQEYDRLKRLGEENPEKLPRFDMKLEAMLPVIRGEMPLKCHAHQVDDICTAVRIAKEFGLRYTLDHCTDGHLIAGRLAEEGAPVFIGPTLGSKTKHEVRNKTFETPGILHRAGVKVSIITDAPVVPEKYLALHTALAVKAGLPEEAGWEAITINPAQVLGVDHRIGSLEEGKDADIVLFRGNPLREADARAMYTLIDGEIVYRDPLAV